MEVFKVPNASQTILRLSGAPLDGKDYGTKDVFFKKNELVEILNIYLKKYNLLTDNNENAKLDQTLASALYKGDLSVGPVKRFDLINE